MPRISVQASPRDRASWLALAQEVEAGGFDTLYLADHPGVSAAPFVALAVAAAVTDRIRLGTCVVNAGVWDPVTLANEVATLDLVSEGRVVLGIGAGHTPQEWTATGRAYPSAADRVQRMIEVTEATRMLLAGGPVSYRGEQVTLADASLADDRLPVQDAVPLLVGGNGARVMRFAARNADVVGLTGLARTLADGHSHTVDWSPDAVRRTIDLVGAAASEAGTSPALEALVQHVEITDDADAAARRLAVEVPGTSEADLLSAPFAWIGTIDEIRDALRRHESELGITRYVVRRPAIADVLRITEPQPTT